MESIDINMLVATRKSDKYEELPRRETLLHESVRLNKIELATSLLEAGANVNVKDTDGDTPLSNAIRMTTPDMVSLLLKYNPDFSMPIVRLQFYQNLRYCTSKESIEITRAMISYGFTVNENDRFAVCHLMGSLMSRLEGFTMSIVNTREEFKNYVQEWYQFSLLHHQPFTENQCEILRILRKIIDPHKIEIAMKITRSRNWNLIQLPMSIHWRNLMEFHLVYIGKSNYHRNHGFYTFVSIESTYNSIFLSCYDSNNPVCDVRGRTGLHYAARFGNKEIIESLLNLNSDINATDDEGQTALDYALNRFCILSEDDPTFIFALNSSGFEIAITSLLKHIWKLKSANLYITSRNLKAFEYLSSLISDSERSYSLCADVYSYAKSCRKEVQNMKRKKFFVQFTYYDLLIQNRHCIVAYTKRKDVEDFLLNYDFLEEFEIYGSMLQHQFNGSYLKRGLMDKAEVLLFQILRYHYLPLSVVREILMYFNNDELYFMMINS